MDVNKWFLSLPPERQAVLREDKWMLANAAAEAAAEAEREKCAAELEVKADQLPNGDTDADALRGAADVLRSNAALTRRP